MSEQQEREAFEAWANGCYLARVEDGYTHSTVHAYWVAWQARAKLSASQPPTCAAAFCVDCGQGTGHAPDCRYLLTGVPLVSAKEVPVCAAAEELERRLAPTEYIGTLLPQSCVEHAAMLRDIRDGKLVVVPAEPTKEMILAAETAIADHKDSDWDSGGDGEQSNTYEYFTAGVERSVYRAMLAASQEKP